MSSVGIVGGEIEPLAGDRHRLVVLAGLDQRIDQQFAGDLVAMAQRDRLPIASGGGLAVAARAVGGTKIGIGIAEARLQRQGSLQGGDRLIGGTARDQDGGQIIERLGEIRADRQGTPIARLGLVDGAIQPQQQADIGERIGKIRCQRETAAIGFACLRHFAGLIMEIGEIVPGARIARLAFQRPADERDALVAPTLLDA